MKKVKYYAAMKGEDGVFYKLIEGFQESYVFPNGETVYLCFDHRDKDHWEVTEKSTGYRIAMPSCSTCKEVASYISDDLLDRLWQSLSSEVAKKAQKKMEEYTKNKGRNE